MAPGACQVAGTAPVRELFCSARIWRRGKAPLEPHPAGRLPLSWLSNSRLQCCTSKGTAREAAMRCTQRHAG